MSATVLGIMCAVIVVALVFWLIMVRNAANHPGQKRRRKEPMRGVVQGGQHVGGGRSVAPHRDAPVPPDGGVTPAPETPDAEDAEAERARQGTGHPQSGSPMDL
jgi:hypothetical protein